MEFGSKAITERLFCVAERLDIINAQLAKEIGLNRGNMPKYRNGTSDIPAWRVIVFLRNHREINTDWLLFGDGEMFDKSSTKQMTITENGKMVFTTHREGEIEKRDEVKKIHTLLEEKEKHNSSLQATVKNQDLYIKKLLDNL